MSHSEGPATKAALGILALFVGFFLYTFFLLMLIGGLIVDSATQTVYSQLRAIRDGEMRKAYDYVPLLFMTQRLMRFSNSLLIVMIAIKKNQGIKITSHSLEATENSETDNLSKVWNIEGVVYSAKDSMPVQYRLVYEDHEYKILNIKVSPMAAMKTLMITQILAMQIHLK